MSEAPTPGLSSDSDLTALRPQQENAATATVSAAEETERTLIEPVTVNAGPEHRLQATPLTGSSYASKKGSASEHRRKERTVTMNRDPQFQAATPALPAKPSSQWCCQPFHRIGIQVLLRLASVRV